MPSSRDPSVHIHIAIQAAARDQDRFGLGVTRHVATLLEVRFESGARSCALGCLSAPDGEEARSFTAYLGRQSVGFVASKNQRPSMELFSEM